MPSETDSTATAAPPDTMTQAKGTIDEESRSVKAPAETDKASEVVKKVKTASDYFNTLAKDAREPKLIKAIIDENIKAVDGSRVRLRLLDDIEINESVVRRGTYLYATVSGFSSGRVKEASTAYWWRTNWSRSACQSTIRTGWKDFTYPSASSARQARMWRAVPCRAA